MKYKEFENIRIKLNEPSLIYPLNCADQKTFNKDEFGAFIVLMKPEFSKIWIKLGIISINHMIIDKVKAI